MTDELLLNRHIALGDDVLRREVGDELILLNLDSEAYYGLNHTGRALVEEMVGGATPSEAATIVARAHEEPVDPVRDDVLELVRELLDAGLVEVAST